MSNDTATKQTGGKGKIQPRWKAGESGNPTGATPQFPHLEKGLRQLLCKRNKDGIAPVEIIVMNLITAALNQDVAACAAILDLVYGKCNQKSNTNKKIKDVNE